MTDPHSPDPAVRQHIPPQPNPAQPFPAQPVGTPPGSAPSAAWQRLDRRMLLVHPITELIRFIPVLLATLVAGARADSPMWSLGVVGIIVVLAITRWFTTTYRITPDNVELRTGLIQRKRLSVPRNRVRSVDVEADLLHRALGLAVLSIGTGQQAERGDRFKLDSLDAGLVPALRTTLLEHTREQGHNGAESTAAPEDTDDSAGVTLNKPIVDLPAPATHAPVEITHWQSKWVRYAPLSLTGFAIIAPIVGLLFQYGFARIIFDSSAVQGVEDGGAQAIALAVTALFVFLVAFVSLAACARYLTTYYGLKVVDDGATLNIRHGLFTTRQTTLDLARLRGATVNEPLLLRMAGAAELETIMTGTKSRQKIVPQAPRAAVDHTLAHLLDSTADLHAVSLGAGTTPAASEVSGARAVARVDGSGSAEPALPIPPVVTAELRGHGPAATRRRYTRALSLPGIVAVVFIAISLAGRTVPLWVWTLLTLVAVIATALAWDRARGLGHTVIPATGDNPAWLITRSGSLDRDRDCLEGPGIIGWTVRQSWFQRRVGLATVTAATAAGKKRYHVMDIPLEQVWPLIEAVTPGQLGTR